MRNAVLVVFSLIFYAWGEPVYVFLMLGSVVVNYLCGRLIDAASARRGWALALGVAANILILGTFKYAGFFAQILCDVGIPVGIPNISLPIGISFYTFQSLSYLIDVYRREAPVQRNFGGLLLYISMFPQLIAGPIVRYDTVAREISERRVTASDLADGVFRFSLGLGKKVILANQLGEIATQFLTNGLADLTTSGAWIGAIAYMLQIYFDFSGYSDMAIGLGRGLGFHFNENFRHPYCANSITDFWRRWHISLGSFFRDYVYIPLGGNRRHQALNILTVWFLTGMWHGASWNFIIWGLYFGLLVSVEKYTILKLKGWAWQPLLHIYSLLLVLIGWGIFYYDNFDKMLQFFGKFFGQSGELHNFETEAAFFDNFWLWIVAIAFSLPLRTWAVSLTERIFTKEGAARQTVFTFSRIVVSLLLVGLSVCLLVGATNNAFIYTRF